MGWRKAQSQSQPWAACGSTSITSTTGKQIFGILYFPEVHDLFLLFLYFGAVWSYDLPVFGLCFFFLSTALNRGSLNFFSLWGGGGGGGGMGRG